MSEREEENPIYPSKPREPPSTVARESLMDLDFDLYATLSSDQNPFVSNPESPFLLSYHASPSQNSLLISSFEQPFSPLWIFSDVDEEMSAGNANSAFAGDLRFAECPKFLSCNPNTVTGNLERGEEKSRILPEATGLALQENLDGSYVIKEKMMQALRYLKDSADQHVLAQVWAPVKNGDRYVLTTSEQPFVIDPNSTRLLQYRTVSLMYMFSVDGESEGDLGLPGRVFRQKLPEWTPNVQYYSSKEYPRLNHALHCNVQGTLALPVFESSGKSCVGVIELILTSQKINYAPEVDKVCKALEAVNLQSSGILDHSNTQICNEGRQNALTEILEVLSVVCETHKLPLAQTWVPCMHRTILTHGGGVKKSCTSFDGSCMGKICMSTTVAFYVIDSQMWGFRDACSEHHLQKGQGVAGKAFSSHKSCFCRDITRFSKTEYPLVHYARVFGLTGCFAICLRSNHTGSDDYILEFFLPPSVTESKEQEALLDSLFTTMKQHFRSLMVASGEEFEEEKKSIEIIEISIDEKIDLETKSPQDHDGEMIMPDSLGQQYLEETDALKNGDNIVCADGSHNLVSSFDTKGMRKTIEKRRGKTEKSISLEILQQYFAGSLKDAAKSLGVCPTTMKRICRQHGISRWPSRKINKVNRSLSKLKRVIESVQGAEGAFGLTSLTTSPLPVAAGSISWPVSLGGPNRQPTPCSMPPGSQDGKERASPIHNTLPSDGNCEIKEQMLGGRPLIDPEVINEDSGSHPGSEKGFDGLKSKTGSGDESTETPTSHGSCQGSPAKEGIPLSQPPFVSLLQEQGAFQPTGEVILSPLYSISNALITTQEEATLCGMLIEDAGSSKDLRNLCNPTTEGYHDERLPITHDPRTVTIKATYRDDIIRFRLSLSSSVVELKEEVAKRLKLEVGTFDIKYLDDDHEWVILVCDADLQECMDISRSSVRNMIRLLVHDLISSLGSSCESSGE